MGLMTKMWRCVLNVVGVRQRSAFAAVVLLLGVLTAQSASASDQIYFSANTNITNLLVQKINAETVRIDMAIWHLTEHSISIALLNRFKAGVPVRLIGDRAELFEINAVSKQEFYWLANEGVPIRVRFNPTWYPEISHWKATIFAGQNLVAFGSANYTPFELAPVSSTNYKDETVLFSDDPVIVNALRTKFDRMWNDTTPEPESLISAPPYLKDWNEACETDHTGACDDYHQLYPNPKPMIIDTARLEPDNPLPPEIVWGQGPSFNNRLIQEINAESSLVQFVIYRMTVPSITNALLAKWQAGVPVQLLIEPAEYVNRAWPEFWLTHAYLDQLWAAGVPMKQRIHQGLTHMKTLVTSNYASNASSNYAAAWQRDVNYFVPKAAKPAIYQAIKDQVTAMWNDPAAFGPFQPLAPDAPTLSTPAANATAVDTAAPLVWDRAAFTTSYDVYLGTSSGAMTLVANVPAELTNTPPLTYSWTPPALQSGTTYFWKVVSRTFATPVNPALVAASPTRSFTTAGTTAPPAAPSTPSPSDGAIQVGNTPTLGWSAGALGTTFNVAFGPSNPPPTVATGLTTATYAPGALAPSTTYFWNVTAVSSGGTTPGPVWSFTTASTGGITPTDVVIYAADVTTTAGTWTKANDTTAAAGVKLTNPDNAVAALPGPLANPTNYFETTFNAVGGTRYRVWLRVHAIGDQKWNDSIFVQFSDSQTGSGAPSYRIGTASGYAVNLWTCADCQSIGWGWQRNAYWLGDTGDVWFQNSGSHTIRVQIREDGAEIDQIVLSPDTYGTNPPGPV
jgi:phosphatidylserine/phosphatidylglycerophosphate/cardiolipin synthase-like enzyme